MNSNRDLEIANLEVQSSLRDAEIRRLEAILVNPTTSPDIRISAAEDLKKKNREAREDYVKLNELKAGR